MDIISHVIHAAATEQASTGNSTLGSHKHASIINSTLKSKIVATNHHYSSGLPESKVIYIYTHTHTHTQ